MNQYLTTPIYYASGTPHLGHAYTSLVAECYRRYHKLKGHPTLLVTGTDEHGQKIERTAKKHSLLPGEFVAARSAEFRNLWQTLDIRFDRFVRTTDVRHRSRVESLWNKLLQQGDLYKGNYSGLYCIECEQYFASGEACPVHRRPLEKLTEDSWFFRLSNYQQRLIDHITSHDDFILPKERRNEVLALLNNNELHDLSVSRQSTTWGIPVPGDPGHVIYVWLDALTAYVSALEDDEFSDFWPGACHFIGKDILIFHAVYWPAILWSVGIALPRSIFVNGWLTAEQRKIAKSEPTTIIAPENLLAEFTCDGLAYYFLKSIPFGQDANFSRRHLVDLLNADLANNLGNLVRRVTSLITSQFEGEISIESPDFEPSDQILVRLIDETANTWHESFLAGRPDQAARQVIELSSAVNRYLHNEAPWTLCDSEQGKARAATVLLLAHNVIKDIALLGEPFFPSISCSIRTSLCLPAAQLKQLGQLSRQVKVVKEAVLFNKINQQ